MPAKRLDSTTAKIVARNYACEKGLIPRRRNSSREILAAKYGWLHMSDSIEISHSFRFRSE